MWTWHFTFTYSNKITLVKLMHFFQGVGGFQKSYVIFWGGRSKYLLFLTGVGGWSGKGQKHPYVTDRKMIPNSMQ